MTTCDVCKDEIKHGESHLGPPFIDGVRHMRCFPPCEKCGMKLSTQHGWNHDCKGLKK